MPYPALPVTLLALMLPALAAGDGAPVRRQRGVELTQLTIHERIVIRVPMTAVPPPRPIKWKEMKGPKCIVAATMAGAIVSAPDQVDLVMLGGQRIRAKLESDCRPLDFYSGFYVRPAADGMICAERDPIRVRSGASCPIDQFRTLKPGK